MGLLNHKQKQYLINHCETTNRRTIARELDLTVKQVYGLIRRYKLGQGKTKHREKMPDKAQLKRDKKFILNPNPPTALTETLICRYYYDTGGDIKDISLELGRTEEYIKSVLDECMSNGNYEKHNKYGR